MGRFEPAIDHEIREDLVSAQRSQGMQARDAREVRVEGKNRSVVFQGARSDDEIRDLHTFALTVESPRQSGGALPDLVRGGDVDHAIHETRHPLMGALLLHAAEHFHLDDAAGEKLPIVGEGCEFFEGVEARAQSIDEEAAIDENVSGHRRKKGFQRLSAIPGEMDPPTRS